MARYGKGFTLHDVEITGDVEVRMDDVTDNLDLGELLEAYDDKEATLDWLLHESDANAADVAETILANARLREAIEAKLPKSDAPTIQSPKWGSIGGELANVAELHGQTVAIVLPKAASAVASFKGFNDDKVLHFSADSAATAERIVRALLTLEAIEIAQEAV
jgi:hypothetical protein